MAFVSVQLVVERLRQQRQRYVRSRRAVVCAAAVKAERVAEFCRDVANIEAPPHLETFLDVIESQDQTLVDPSDRDGLHPFFIPISRGKEDSITGLMRWPTPPNGMDVPIVQGKRDSLELKLVATSASNYIKRTVAEYNAMSKHPPFSVPADMVLKPGAVDELGLGIERYIVLKLGAFPDIYEGLSVFHETKGDIQSSLVCAERAGSAFPGWGRPHAFHARLLQRSKRMLEARDAARFALQLPLWTLGDDLAEISKLAGYHDMTSLAKIYTKLAEDERPEEINEGKPPEQVALDRAAYLLDASFATGDKDWSRLKHKLAELYEMGRVTDVANFLRA